LTATLPAQPVDAANLPPLEPVSAVAPFVLEDPPKINEWTGSVSIGLTYTDGNSDTRSANFATDAEYRREKDRFTVRAYWNYAEQDVDGEKEITTRRAGIQGKYDYFLSKKVYLFGIVGIETDTFQDLEKRKYIGAGVGYQWRESEHFKWSSEIGATYFTESYREQDDPSEKEYIAARVANNIGWQINENLRLEQLAEAFPSLEDADDFYGKADSKLKITFTESMFGQIQHIFQYDNTPSEGLDRIDNLVAISLGWGF
jgi:putative salt-induced outer membrane protein YdiY